MGGFMQSNLEQVTGLIRGLPLEDLDKLRKAIDDEEKAKRQKNENTRDQLERFQRAQDWVFANREKYMNEWVCLEGSQLIAHGPDALEVHKKALEAGIKIPYLEHIVEESDWGGGGNGNC
jgi:hypothetical protein